MAAANSSNGVLGKMISPRNLAFCPAAVGIAGQEGVIFRKVFGWSIGAACAAGVAAVSPNHGRP
jgi:lactate permease